MPIGGGALSGTDLSHVDRAGAYAARHAALHAVLNGAGACQVTVAYTPNRDVPLDVVYEIDRRAERFLPPWFAHSAARERYRGGAFVAALGTGGHFVEPELPWNRATATGVTLPRRVHVGRSARGVRAFPFARSALSLLDRRNSEIAADLPCEVVADLRMPRDCGPFTEGAVLPP
jgi:hypothetical protein